MNPSRELVWLNGSIIPMADATISLEDRGFQFADGVYEVIRIYNGIAFTLAEHMDRLERSATGIGITMPMSRRKLAATIADFIEQTTITEGMVYLQLTRGVAPRNHAFPRAAKPTLLFYVRPLPPVNQPGEGLGQKLITVPDERWKRCWIKAISLLANVIAKNQALDSGADEAVFTEDGVVSECSASNLFAVIGKQIITHPVGPKVLPGITRLVLLQLASSFGFDLAERPLCIDEAKLADELFITSTTRELHWVSTWDDKIVAGGRCGPITRQLHEAYRAKVVAETQAREPAEASL